MPVAYLNPLVQDTEKKQKGRIARAHIYSESDMLPEQWVDSGFEGLVE